jgi:putative protease
MTINIKPELLAPAGGPEALAAAVGSGADAVYLGGAMFSARQSAANFDHQQLAAAVKYAHIHGVKIYVTVNTLVADAEMESALKFMHFLQNIGADAAIVQDLGLAGLARQVVPELPLHASTQMTAHNIPGVEQLLESGFSRVVLAREMSLGEIERINNTTGAELEVFIHGALCICYSGQCLLSSMIGGRSGNRGRCAQPCRMNYILTDTRGEPVAGFESPGDYLLSPRDLNISRRLPELIRAGIKSFKIEGRMKRPEYVATVVRIYRSLIDRALAGGHYEVTPEESRDLTQIFNRDFTSGYFFGSQGSEMMSYRRPNNRGVRLGRVKASRREDRLVDIALEEPLRKGDGLEIWVSEGGRTGTEVGELLIDGRRVEEAPAGAVVSLSVPGRIRTGDRVFKTHDAKLMERARAVFASPGGSNKIPLFFKVKAGVGLPLTLTIGDGRGFTARASTHSAGQPAQRHPLNRELLLSKLGRLGNTPFSLKELDCDIQGEVVYPVSEINEARREALARFENDLLDSRRNPPLAEEVFTRRLDAEGRKSNMPGKKRRGGPLLAAAVGDTASLRAAVKAGADMVYLGAEYFHSKPPLKREEIVRAASYCRENGAGFVFYTPRITRDNELDQILEQIRLLNGILADGILAGNSGLLRLVRKHFPGIPAVADYGFNVFNRGALKYLLGLGCSRVTLSPELTMEQVGGMGAYPVEVLVQGAMELMISEYCAPGSLLGKVGPDSRCLVPCPGQSFALKDRTGAIFPVETDNYCRMHIFNSRDLCLIDDVENLAAIGIDALRIEARRESPEYVREAVGAYRRVIDAAPGADRQRQIAQARETLARLSPAGITKGHYYRGV